MVFVNSTDEDKKTAPVNVDEIYTEAKQLSKWENFKDSFREYEMAEMDPNLSEAERALIATANSPLARKLKNRHIQMIAIGGAIGTGLFIGSGKALATGGPAALLIAWLLVGFMIYTTIHALGELAVAFPMPGAFSVYSTRFISPSWGFAMGWNYALQWLIVLPLELVAASITISFWNSEINNVAFIAIFYVLILIINVFGVKGYGEAEFVFSLIKVIAVVAFIFLGIILTCGGGPKGGYIGGKHWHTPGAFAAGFKGVCSVFVTAAFSFAGTELVGLASAETENPRKSLPKATKQVVWRIALFYIISLTLIGLLVPYDDEKLVSGATSYDASASPFVIAIRNAGIGGLPSVMNVVIMIAVLSVGNSSVYACSRTLVALSTQKQAPHYLSYIDKKGRPLVAVGISMFFGLLSFVSASPKEGEVFDWLLALSGLSSIFTWGSVCFCHIRFRRALTYHGRGTDELAFVSQPGVIGSWFGFVLNALILVAQFWVALYPIGESPDAAVFFQSYLAVPVVILFWVFAKIWKKEKELYVKLENVDIDTGRREFDLEILKQEIAEDKALLKLKPWYIRTYHFWC